MDQDQESSQEIEIKDFELEKQLVKFQNNDETHGIRWNVCSTTCEISKLIFRGTSNGEITITELENFKSLGK